MLCQFLAYSKSRLPGPKITNLRKLSKKFTKFWPMRLLSSPHFTRRRLLPTTGCFATARLLECCRALPKSAETPTRPSWTLPLPKVRLGFVGNFTHQHADCRA